MSHFLDALFGRMIAHEGLLTGFFGLLLIFLAIGLRRFSRTGRQSPSSQKLERPEDSLGNIPSAQVQTAPAEIHELAEQPENNDPPMRVS